ncbi:hypothetical protein P3X46_001224 [Hevea brasiliensis]|uniref:Aminotransferase-like plant mobile domain-containing protein n=1 Tax=Hevea brasiliensis TaxID=3981 RepID=A0ABQ9NFV0_HEVBR|nr:hypothetical protein P3X46_001224 [Hevea brasiliensis]
MQEEVITCRRHADVLHLDAPLQLIVPHLTESGFIGVSQMRFFVLDWHLISALIERWRPEMHTFILLIRECTITLEDIDIITRLPIDDHAVTGNYRLDWPSVCEEYLGIRPPPHVFKGCGLYMSWLIGQFEAIPEEADDATLLIHARAYIMRLIVGSLFNDKSNTRVNLMFLPLLADMRQARQYSWGSACLAYLYRELCRGANPETKEISGALFILQIWAWERIETVALSLPDPAPHDDAPLGSRYAC